MPSYLITIYVADIATVITQYDKLRIYRSTTGLEVDRALYDVLPLATATSTYEWTDASGQDSYVAWFTYYNSSTFAESGFSTSILYGASGERFVPGFSFSSTSYPAEITLSYSESETVYDIRHFIGDPKKLNREYLSPSSTIANQNVSEDRTTYELATKGWPLKVVKDGTEYITSDNPYVGDYRFLTFSGTEISTVSGTLDIWYETFRHSDREILKAYNNTSNPPGVSAADVTADMIKLRASIGILRQELTRLMGETSGSFTLAGEMSYNPEPLLRQKKQLLGDLEKKLDELVDASTSWSITGVRID